ncbi:MAG: ribosomal protein [Candidatus Thermoplasmatota archaeon]|nr:ribosomal protein [Candidatus Thermoplasmatota archaeon]
MASERKFIAEKVRRVLLREFVQARVTRAGFGGLDVQRTPMGTRVTLITERPGLVIGRRGEAIKSLTKAIEEDFKFNNPQIEVQEVENPNLNAQIMAEKLANALERGWHFRRAGHSTVRRIMESGAKGCQVVISGKLTGQRHRTEKFKDGHIKYCGQAKLDFMQNGFAVAKLKPGVIGITVRIMDPNARLPDEIDIIPPKPVEAPVAPAAPAPDAKEEEKKVDEAVQELRKSAEGPKPEEKPKKRKKKEGDAPAAEGEEKKPRKQRKKKDEGEAAPEAGKAPGQPAPTPEPAVEPAPETKGA